MKYIPSQKEATCGRVNNHRYTNEELACYPNSHPLNHTLSLTHSLSIIVTLACLHCFFFLFVIFNCKIKCQNVYHLWHLMNDNINTTVVKRLAARQSSTNIDFSFMHSIPFALRLMSLVSERVWLLNVCAYDNHTQAHSLSPLTLTLSDCSCRL